MTFQKVSLLKVFVFLIGLTVFFPVAHAVAQQSFYNMEKPMPEFERMPMEEFENATKLYNEDGFNDERLNYSIRIPKNWVKSNNRGSGHAVIDKKVMYELGRYYGPPSILSERSYVSINALELTYELTVEQWFAIYVMKNRYNLEGVKIFDDQHIESLHVHVDRGNTFAVRSAVWITGRVLFMVQYFVPMEEWQEKMKMAQRVVESFKVDVSSEDLVEDMRSYRFLDIAEVFYPVSWGLKAPVLRSADTMSVSLSNVETDQLLRLQVLKGKIDIYLLSDFVVDDVETELAAIKKQMSADVLLVDEPVEADIDFELSDSMNMLSSGASMAIDRSQSAMGYEFWYNVMRSGEYYYFVTLLTPSRENDYENWARNIHTFRIVNERITPLN